MTAEVAVLNTSAVALAADSAVSVGPTANKIYTSVDKLFQLVEEVPVGIVVYGSADLLGIPWETIIKTYRHERNGLKCSSLADYRDDFLDFLSSHNKLFPRDTQIHFAKLLVRRYLNSVIERIQKALNQQTDSNSDLTEQDRSKFIHEFVRSELEWVTSKKRLLNFDIEFVRAIRSRLVNLIKPIKDKIFAGLQLELRTTRLITRLVIEVLTRDYMSPLHTGLVFAGFGEDEFMPKLYSVNVEILIFNRIRASEDEHRCKEITHEMQASIIPFADSDMVHSFIRGIHRENVNYMFGTLSGILQTFKEQILEVTQAHDSEFAARLERAISDKIPLLIEELSTDWLSQIQKHSRPIVANLGALPKDELGAMAESLVNLTKFRRRFSQDRETVSGPIDVAVISKGDGFIWVKRKHYFIPELNPRIMSKYTRSE